MKRTKNMYDLYRASFSFERDLGLTEWIRLCFMIPIKLIVLLLP